MGASSGAVEPVRSLSGRSGTRLLSATAGSSKARSATSKATMSRTTRFTGITMLYTGVLLPVLRLALRLVRRATHVHASLAGCLAVLAMLVALSGVLSIAMLGLARHVTHVRSNILRPLDFDYSSPAAVAHVSLLDPAPAAGYGYGTLVGRLALALGLPGAAHGVSVALASPPQLIPPAYAPSVGGGAGGVNGPGGRAAWDKDEEGEGEGGYDDDDDADDDGAQYDGDEDWVEGDVPLDQEHELEHGDEHPKQQQQQQQTRPGRLQRRRRQAPSSQRSRRAARPPPRQSLQEQPRQWRRRRPPSQQKQQQPRKPATPAALRMARRAPVPPRALQPGQAVSLLLTLELPPDYQELFQVTCELLDLHGQVLQRVMRTHLPRSPSLLWVATKYTLLLPLQLLGWLKDDQLIQLQLVHRYVERQAPALTSVRVLLASRTGGGGPAGALPPPPIYRAHLNVLFKLGLIRRMLCWLAPSWTMTLMVVLGSLSVVLVSGMVALALGLVTIALHRLGSASGGAAAPALPVAPTGHALAAGLPAGPLGASLSTLARPTPRPLGGVHRPEHQRLQEELAVMIRSTQALLNQGRRARSRPTGPVAVPAPPHMLAPKAPAPCDPSSALSAQPRPSASSPTLARPAGGASFMSAATRAASGGNLSPAAAAAAAGSAATPSAPPLSMLARTSASTSVSARPSGRRHATATAAQPPPPSCHRPAHHAAADPLELEGSGSDASGPYGGSAHDNDDSEEEYAQHEAEEEEDEEEDEGTWRLPQVFATAGGLGHAEGRHAGRDDALKTSGAQRWAGEEEGGAAARPERAGGSGPTPDPAIAPPPTSTAAAALSRAADDPDGGWTDLAAPAAPLGAAVKEELSGGGSGTGGGRLSPGAGRPPPATWSAAARVVAGRAKVDGTKKVGREGGVGSREGSRSSGTAGTAGSVGDSAAVGGGVATAGGRSLEASAVAPMGPACGLPEGKRGGSGLFAALQETVQHSVLRRRSPVPPKAAAGAS